MKHLIYSLFLLASLSIRAQIVPDTLDLNKFSGRWYVLASIPGCFDQNWNNITETFQVNNRGQIDIYMTYMKKNQTKVRGKKAKGFPYRENKNTEWEVQFLWPFTSGYVIEELAPDYSYAVVGNAQNDYFYIMSRTEKMDEALFSDILKRSIKKGYEVNDLRIVIQ